MSNPDLQRSFQGEWSFQNPRYNFRQAALAVY
ncbi:hypothetical protein [Bdellovibrio bacteriovorus]